MIGGILILSSLLTSAVSAVFGMAGGMILMAVVTALLAVNQAMIFHGVIQATANFWRALLLRRSIKCGPIGYYLIGALAGCSVSYLAQFQPSRLVVYLSLGIVAFLPRVFRMIHLSLDFSRPFHAILCGLFMMVGQLSAGAAGPILDVFFVGGRMQKAEMVATKAGSQVLSHLLKIGYFAVITQKSGNSIPAPAMTAYDQALLLCSCLASMVGTSLGKQLMDHMSEILFRRSYAALIEVIGLGMLAAAGLQWAKP